MLRATPNSIFTWDFTIRRDGHLVAEVDPTWFGERARATVAGEPYSLTRECLMEGTFAMRSAGRVVARARKPSAFSSTFEVELPGRRLELRAASVWGHTFEVFEGGAPLGRIAPVSWLGREAVIDLPDEIPPHEQVFLFWLVLVLWQRSADSAAASSAAAAGS